MEQYEIFGKNTKAIVYGRKVKAVQRMLDFDYLCGRKPSVIAVINPTGKGLFKVFFGKKEIFIPVYQTLNEALSEHDATVVVNLASFRSAYETSKEALLHKKIKVVAIIAEGIPERLTRELISISKKEKKIIIGPATVGGIKARCFKIGNTAGDINNIISSKLHRPGSVGVVCKSGGLSNEMYSIVAQNADGINEGIAIGGDAYPGSTFVDHLLRFEKNPSIKMLVCLGEIGGTDEYEIVKAYKSKKLKKPMVMWVSGTCAKMFKTPVQFGHAGAVSGVEKESADAKNLALKKVGIIVPNSFDDFGEKIAEVYNKLKKNGKVVEEKTFDVSKRKIDLENRRETHFITTISDDRGDEPIYAGYTIGELLDSGAGIGDMVSLLWFRKRLPKEAVEFIEFVLVLIADHGPSVSGAHNSIVAARAGKDLVSSLASGLLTIGPRFGGAINGAARYFKEAKDSGKNPAQFIKEMKAKGILIPGIGHKIKSLKNPDKRVEVLKKFVKENFKKTEYLDFALEVEKITTEKKSNLILNVDGCIAVCFLDLCDSSGAFTKKEINDIVEFGYLNGFFVLGRSIGLIGHIIDQYRLKENLYRHPSDDILFMVDKE